jgi:hypothetical protein
LVGRRRWVLGATLASLLAAMMSVGARAAEPVESPGTAATGLTATPSEVHIAVISYHKWVANGALYVAGEIRNTSAYRVHGYVTIRISPGHNSPNETIYDLAGISDLAPGGRSPFLVIRSPFAPASTSIVEITAGGYVRPNPGAAVGVSSVSDVQSDPDFVAGGGDVVRVQVRNGTARPVEVFKMIAAFRGADGKVSNMGQTTGGSVVIAPGGVLEDWVPATPSGTLAVRADVDLSAQFADFPYEPVVSWQDWFRDIDGSSLRMSIAWLAEHGITGGCASFRYCPADDVTRAQMAIFLTRAFHLPPASTDYFDDDDGVTGEGSINAVALAGITGGCAPRRYCPAAFVTRAQMAMFLDRALHLPPTTTDYFDDDDGRTGEAATNRLAAAGITGGCATRRFCPSALVTRAQMAGFLKRALE